MMLMYTDHSFDASQNQPWNYGDLVRDLDLKPIIETMAGGDDFIAQVVAKALVIGVDDVDTILYRQGVLEDTLRNIDTVRSVYAIITQAITEGRRRLFWIPNPNPESVVFDSVRTLEVYLDTLDKVREVFDASASQFKSSGFQNLIHSLDYRFDRNYLNSIRLMLSSLEFPSGVSVAVRLGDEAELTKKPLLIISGANRGGKTVYLRSIGQAQLMMQCGMFVAAETFESSISSGVYTHFKREEDKELGGGKLDEELSRLSSIIDHVKPNSMVLFNESFASTNAREGSELAKQTVTALLERKIRVLYVTHFYEFPLWFYENRPSLAVFLVAERKEDGTRTFKVREGVPLETSFAEDVYSKIFGDHTQDEERE